MNNNAGSGKQGWDYWQRQGKTALFPELDTWPPEQKRFAGKLLIIGGNKGAFFTVANMMQAAERMGVGEVRVMMPKSLRGAVPNVPGVMFAEAEPSGAFAKAALQDMQRESDWADVVFIAGDLSKNAGISLLLADFLRQSKKPFYMMRDAIDAATPEVETWSLREGQVTLLATVPQLQKLLRTLYYPKMIALSMPTNQLVETLHKFTLSYEMAIASYHNEQLIFAQDGKVVTMALDNTEWSPITLWGGDLLLRACILKLWNVGASELACLATGALKDD